MRLSKQSASRIAKGIRRVESIYGSMDVLPPGYSFPPGGASPVDVLVKEERITSTVVLSVPNPPAGIRFSSEFGFYPSVFTFRNPVSETEANDYFDSDYFCLAVPLNDKADPPEVLVVGRRYKGHIVGYRNGKPVVVVVAGLGQIESGAGLSGSGGSGEGELNTISFEFVSDVTCASSGGGSGALVVTKKTAYITGRDLSVSVQED